MIGMMQTNTMMTFRMMLILEMMEVVIILIAMVKMVKTMIINVIVMVMTMMIAMIMKIRMMILNSDICNSILLELPLFLMRILNLQIKLDVDDLFKIMRY